jgi:hypothetical protein
VQNNIKEKLMDGLDTIFLVIRPIIFVILPAWAFHAWIGEATLGAVIGFSYMWNGMITRKNSQFWQAVIDVQKQLDRIGYSQAFAEVRERLHK